MFKLLKYALYLVIIFYAIQYFHNHKGVLPLAFPDEFPKIFSRIPLLTSDSESPKQSTADLVEKIQKNELREIQNIWRKLGVKSELFKKSAPSLADYFTVTLNPGGDSLYIYQIADRDNNDWQYLFFTIKNRSWNFYGHIDLPNQASSEPIARSVTIEDRNWLIITSKTDSPDLAGMYYDHWYDLKASQLKEVLRYPVYHDQPSLDFIKRYSATVLDTGIIAGSYYIDLKSQIAFINGSHSTPEPAFTVSRKVRYLWDYTNQLFKDHNQQQQEKLYTYGANEVLVQNFLQIEKLAENGNTSQRNLLRKFLKLCDDNSEKKGILKYLINRPH